MNVVCLNRDDSDGIIAWSTKLSEDIASGRRAKKRK